MEQKKRITFYVDGFNFYFGLKRTKQADKDWKNYYWIDIAKLFNSFLGKNQILEKVVYFTASPLDPQKNSRQSAFLNANKLINGDKFEIVRGKYTKNLRKNGRMRAKCDKWLVHIPFLCYLTILLNLAEGAEYGGC